MQPRALEVVDAPGGGMIEADLLVDLQATQGDWQPLPPVREYTRWMEWWR
jgi:hypothetical protein